MSIGQQIAVGFLFLGLYVLLNSVLQIVLDTIDIRDKIKWTIKLPKKKRFLTKVDPIYKVEDSDVYYNKVDIHKFYLKYRETGFTYFLSWAVIPYPVEILSYRYSEATIYTYPGDKGDFVKETRSLKELYEEQDKEHREEWEEEKRVRENHRNAMRVANKEFIENYE